MTDDEVVAWVKRTCQEQGVPFQVTDPLALSKIAAVLRDAAEADAAA